MDGRRQTQCIVGFLNSGALLRKHNLGDWKTSVCLLANILQVLHHFIKVYYRVDGRRAGILAGNEEW